MGIEKEVYVLEKDQAKSQESNDTIDKSGADETNHSISTRSHLLTKIFTRMKGWGGAIGMKNAGSHQQERFPPQRIRFFR